MKQLKIALVIRAFHTHLSNAFQEACVKVLGQFRMTFRLKNGPLERKVNWNNKTPKHHVKANIRQVKIKPRYVKSRKLSQQYKRK